jgi:hypothetical protein
MLTIIRKTDKGRTRTEYKIYTLEDVRSGLFTEKYTYWKELTPGDEGKWALSDYGYIGEFLKVTEYKVNRRSKKKNYFVKLSFGNCFIGKRTQMLFEDRQANNSWSYVKPQHWTDWVAKRDRTRIICKAAATMHLNGKVDYARIGRMYRHDHLIPEATGRRFLKIRQIKEMVMEELKRY